MNLLTVVGARPQFIKAATISRQVALRTDIRELIVHTGQHFDADMSDIFFEELSIPRPDYHLGIGGGTHGLMTGRQLEAIEAVILKEKPDWVLVYGDTNSTLAGGLAAAKLNVPVAHVEAGLRSFNRRMPEEINRILTDHLSTMLFAPTDLARANLRAEGVSESSIRVSGDVMYDAALFYRDRARCPESFAATKLKPRAYILATIHRAENTDNPARMAAMFEGLARSGEPVVLPLHPRTRQTLDRLQIPVPDNIYLVPPVGYLEMVWLEVNCRVIATDSGGVQKEAYFHGKPCVTLRDETEWVELVETGWNVLVGADSCRIADAIRRASPAKASAELYGTGNAAAYIVDCLVR